MTIKLKDTGLYSGLTRDGGAQSAGGEAIPTHMLSAERLEAEDRERARWQSDLPDVVFLRRRDFVVAGDRLRPSLDGRRVSLEKLREVAARERRLLGAAQYESAVPYDYVDDDGNLLKSYPSRAAFLEAQQLGLLPESPDTAPDTDSAAVYATDACAAGLSAQP